MLLHFPLVFMTRFNKIESAVFYYSFGLVVLGCVRAVVFTINSHEQTQ